MLQLLSLQLQNKYINATIDNISITYFIQKPLNVPQIFFYENLHIKEVKSLPPIPFLYFNTPSKNK